jgi:hydroxymethylpyrimidine kinase/phosphomethylpyrimidine kinase
MSAVLEDLPVAVVKTGMFPSAEVVSIVTHRARDGSLPNLVVDPVLSLESRSRKAVTGALTRLLPYALVVTPNRDEASALLGWQVATVTDMAAAAAQLAAAGPKYVVVTGGDMVVGDEAIDAVWADGSVRFMHAPRLSARNSQGSGAVFSAALAGRIALGDQVLDALAFAKSVVGRAISDASQWKLGGGRGPVDVFGWSSPVP